MSLRWEIDNKVQALKRWVRQRFGRATDNQPRRTGSGQEQADGRAEDTPQPPR